MDKWDEDTEMEELSDFFRIPGRWKNALPVTASHPYPLDPLVPTKPPEIAIEEKLERIKILRMTLKRIREEEASDRLQLQEFARKHPWNTHRVAFHPDTNDNSLPSSGGRLRRRQRSSTPFPSEDNDDDRESSSDVDMEEVSATSHQPELSSATPGPSMTLRNREEPENSWILDKPAFFAMLQSTNGSSPKSVSPPLASSQHINPVQHSKGLELNSHGSQKMDCGGSRGAGCSLLAGANDWRKRHVLRNSVSSALLSKGKYWLCSRS